MLMGGTGSLSKVAGHSHSNSATLDAWIKESCSGPTYQGWLPGRRSTQLLLSSHVQERQKALLRRILVGRVWNEFLFGKVRGQIVPWLLTSVSLCDVRILRAFPLYGAGRC